jgi:hypothetical protein
MRSAILILLLLAGCTRPDLSRAVALNAAIGQSQADLLRELGPPARATQTGATQHLTYIRAGAVTDPFRPDPSTVPLVDAVGAAFNYPPEANVGRCATTFDVTGGRVTGWRVRGAAC